MVDVGAVQQFQELVIVQSLVNPFGDGLELFEIDDPVFILVEDGEDPSESVLGLGLSDFVSHHIQELVEVDGFVLILEGSDQTQDEGVSLVDSQFFKGF